MIFPIERYREWFAAKEEFICQEFSSFLAFKSISTDPLHKKDCLDAAKWLLEYLGQIGMKGDLLTSSGLPVVFAEHGSSKDKTVLLYQHYDVQPVDPIEQWVSDPFIARWEGGKVFARGASDNKGQCFLTIQALKALLEIEEELSLNVKLFIEGEEESGSKGTLEVVQREKQRLRADCLCVMDFDLVDQNTPSIVLGYRGLMGVEITCQNADVDLHSGIHGGMALNPIHILSCAISRLWDRQGRVAIPHFYDAVVMPLESERKKIDFFLDEELYRKEYGIGAFCKEEGFSMKESGGIRPTVEVNGIWGGYTGVGFKTVIPSTAYAKLSCRLVPGQDPIEIKELVSAFLQENMPKGVRLEVKGHHGAKAFQTKLDSPLIQTVAKSLEAVFQKSCKYTLCGGSVPIVQELAEATQGEVALFGFALATDNIHSPNEHFRWECFKKGFLSMAQILWSLAQEKRS